MRIRTHTVDAATQCQGHEKVFLYQDLMRLPWPFIPTLDVVGGILFRLPGIESPSLAPDIQFGSYPTLLTMYDKKERSELTRTGL
jgi:hypothetical protein